MRITLRRRTLGHSMSGGRSVDNVVAEDAGGRECSRGRSEDYVTAEDSGAEDVVRDAVEITLWRRTLGYRMGGGRSGDNVAAEDAGA